MAQYTRSLAEQFSQEEATIGWSWRIFVFAGVVFTSAILFYVGISFGYYPYLSNRFESIKADIETLKQSVSPEDQKRLVSFYSQIYNIQNILGSHGLPSRLFVFLENNTSPRVYFKKMAFAADTSVLTLEGVAFSYDDLVKQLEGFKRANGTQVVLLQNSLVEERTNFVNFVVRVVLKKEFLKP